MEARTLALDDVSIEELLRLAGESAIDEARSIDIKSQQDYDRAAGFLLEIKRRAKQMKEFWRPAKDAAREAHAQICQREKVMLAPLEEAEKVVKKGMVGYQMAVEVARVQAEREAQRSQQEERDRLLAEAAEAEKAGNVQGAMVGMAMAEIVEDMKAPQTVPFEQARGTRTRRRWRARVIDEHAVPAYAGGVQLRRIDQGALDRLAALSEGAAAVPGVEFYQETIISARA